MTNTEIDYDDADPFPTPTPKKRGRPATKKQKPATARWLITEYKADELTTILRQAARVLEPGCIGNIPKQLKIAAELLELIENKKG